jgi:hypothetical protein
MRTYMSVSARWSAISSNCSQRVCDSGPVPSTTTVTMCAAAASMSASIAPARSRACRNVLQNDSSRSSDNRWACMVSSAPRNTCCNRSKRSRSVIVRCASVVVSRSSQRNSVSGRANSQDCQRSTVYCKAYVRPHTSHVVDCGSFSALSALSDSELASTSCHQNRICRSSSRHTAHPSASCPSRAESRSRRARTADRGPRIYHLIRALSRWPSARDSSGDSLGLPARASSRPLCRILINSSTEPASPCSSGRRRSARSARRCRPRPAPDR